MVNTLRDLFFESVNRAPGSLFLADAHLHLTYEAVRDRAYHRALILLKLGVCPQDRVFIVDEDPLETTLWFLACTLAGIIFIVLHQNTSIMRMEYLLKDVEPVGVIDTGSDYTEIYEKMPQIRFVIDKKDINDMPVENHVAFDVNIIGTDPAFFIYTSGSSGVPRAVICSHSAVLYATASINAYLPNTSQDRIGHFLPLSFVYGLYQIYLAMQVQASVIFLGKFRYHIDLLTRVNEQCISALPAIRPVLASFARLSPKDCKIESLKYLTSAGDYLPPPLIEKILQRFPKSQFFSMYGLSECGRALYMPPDRIASKPEAVGHPIPGTRAFIIDEMGELVPPGVVGELVVEGPHIMNGYWRAPEETKASFTYGPYGQPRLRTGDFFFQDQEGDFHFVSRKQGMLKSRGFRISVQEVETAILMADSAIQECIAYGVEDELLGQALHAEVIINDPSHTISDIFKRCRRGMEAHLIPVKIQIVDVLPTTSSGGKYDRRLVKES